MVQQQFQTALDDYVARRIDEQQLFAATDWAKRWYWPFEGYAPVLRLCRDMNVPLVALDVDGEDKGKVELGGLAALDDAKLRATSRIWRASSSLGARARTRTTSSTRCGRRLRCRPSSAKR